MAPDARVESAQSDSGIYRAGSSLRPRKPDSANHFAYRSCAPERTSRYDPAIGENVRVAYSNDNGRVLPVKERSKNAGARAVKQLTAYRKPRDPGYVGGFYWTPTIVGFIGLFLTNVFATQFVAWRFEYQPALGPALVVLAPSTFTHLISGLSGCGHRETPGTSESNFPCSSAQALLLEERSHPALYFSPQSRPHQGSLEKHRGPSRFGANGPRKSIFWIPICCKHRRVCMSEAGTNSPSSTSIITAQRPGAHPRICSNAERQGGGHRHTDPPGVG